MPLPDDARVVALANDLLQAFDQIFGVHPGYRAAHAKGLMLAGTFTPAAGATALTRAPHITRASTPVTVRFSNSTGMPDLPDNVGDANPRGLAIRFNLAEHVHTDIVGHTTDGFPTRDGYGFLQFLRAAKASGPDVPSPKPIEEFLASHPSALAFVQAPKPFPTSFATDTYYGVTAFEFTNAAGEKKFGRYRITPEAGNRYLSEQEVASVGPNYHFEEIAERLASGAIRFHVRVQIAAPGDITDDATAHWPESRPQIDFGALELTQVLPDSRSQQKHIIFDPIPRVDGIEPSADPLLELRAAIYLLSGRRRRSAPAESVEPAPVGSVAG
jgi:catalase